MIKKSFKELDRFKVGLQAVCKDRGISVSKREAFELYRDMFNGLVDSVLEADGMELSVPGVGKYWVKKSVPKGGRADYYKYIPRLKFKVLRSVDDSLIDELVDCKVEGMIDVKKAVGGKVEVSEGNISDSDVSDFGSGVL